MALMAQSAEIRALMAQSEEKLAIIAPTNFCQQLNKLLTARSGKKMKLRVHVTVVTNLSGVPTSSHSVGGQNNFTNVHVHKSYSRSLVTATTKDSDITFFLEF